MSTSTTDTTLAPFPIMYVTVDGESESYVGDSYAELSGVAFAIGRAINLVQKVKPLSVSISFGKYDSLSDLIFQEDARVESDVDILAALRESHFVQAAHAKLRYNLSKAAR